MKLLLTLVIFALGCADTLEPPTPDGPPDQEPPTAIGKADRSAEHTVGSECAPGCVWSAYAIGVGAQAATHECTGTPCACVRDGDVWSACGTQDAGPRADAGVSDGPVAPAGGVPYFYQYDNSLYPGSSCQNTSVAMVLAHLGWSGRPDDITREWGKDYAQSPDGLNRMFNTIANEHWLAGALWTTTSGALEEFRSAARDGNVIIVHGYFTGYGHVLVVTGFDGEYYTVNDPAGEWSGRFGGGYAGMPEDGEGVRYRRAEFEAAIATSDGRTFLPIWYHVLRRLSR